MLSTSLAVVAMAASAAIPPFGNLVHMHPKTADNRVEVTLVNKAFSFRDVKVDGHSYEVTPGHSVTIKAPAGTVVYRDSFAPFHQRGEVLLSLTPEMNKTIMDLK